MPHLYIFNKFNDRREEKWQLFSPWLSKLEGKKIRALSSTGGTYCPFLNVLLHSSKLLPNMIHLYFRKCENILLFGTRFAKIFSGILYFWGSTSAPKHSHGMRIFFSYEKTKLSLLSTTTTRHRLPSTTARPPLGCL